MIKRLLTVVLVLAAFITHAQVNLSNGLLAYYPFDGDARDYSGNNNHFTIANATLTSDSLNNPISAYSFNGTNAFMGTPTSLNFPGNSFTISVWYQTTQAGGSNYFLTAGNSGGTVRAWTGGNGTAAGVTMVPGATSSASGNGAISGAWTHYLATFDGSTMKIYLNGVFKNSGSYTMASLGALPLQLGILGTSYWNGKLDEIAVYGRVVNASEVTALYQRQNILPVKLSTSLIAYYPFNGNGNDYSGNNNNLQLTSTTLTADANSNANSAYSFDGTTSKMVTPQNVNVNSNRVSVSCWFKTQQVGATYFLSGGSYTLYTSANGATAGMSISNPSTNSASGTSNSNQWNHLVGVYDSTTIKVYINGQLKSVTTHPSAGFGSFPLSIGFFGNSYWAGTLDEVVIYNRAITTAEATALYQRQAVITAPVPNFYASKTTACVGDLINFFDSTQNPVNNWQWTFTGAASTTSSVQNPTGISYSTPGTYAVKLKTSNAMYSDSITKNAYITIVAPPNTPTISTSRSPQMCPGDSVVLTCDSPAAAYQWYKNGNKLVGSTTVTHTTKTSGDYKIEVSNATGCKSTSAVLSVVVNTAPNVPTVSSNKPGVGICLGDSAIFTCDSSATAYQWYFNNTPVANNGTGKTLTAKISGSFKVEVSNAAGCKNISATKTLAVFTLPNIPAVSSNNTSGTICSGDSIILTCDSPATTFQWYNNGNVIAGATNKTLTVKTSGSYTVEITNGSFCKNMSAARNITVNPTPPTPTVSAAATTFCPGSADQLQSSAASGNQWYRNGLVIAGATASTYNATDSGTYTVIVTQGSCASAPSTGKQLSLYAKPVTGSISGNNAVKFNSTEAYSVTNTSGSAYVWTILNGLQTSGANTNSIQVQWGSQTTGKVMVQESSSNGCKGDTVTLNITLTQGTGVEQALGNVNFSIYPNPSKGTFAIAAQQEITAYEIYDMCGKLVAREELAATKLHTVALNGLTSGIYYINVFSNSGNGTHKFCITE